MTESPEPTPDLAAIVERLDRFYREAIADSGYQDFRMMRAAEFEGGVWTYWPLIRANLMFGPPSTAEEIEAADTKVALEAALLREDYANRRTAELERALGEALPDGEGCIVCGQWSPHHDRGCPIDRLAVRYGLVAMKSEHAKILRSRLARPAAKEGSERG